LIDLREPVSVYRYAVHLG